jgi:hypothetical protein
MAAKTPEIYAKSSFYQMLDKLGPVDADEFRKCLRMLQCVSSWFDLLGLPCRRETVDAFATSCLSFVDSGKAPPFSAVEAQEACTQAFEAIYPMLTEEERKVVEQQGNAYSSRMVALAPPDIQAQFALLAAQEWAKELP